MRPSHAIGSSERELSSQSQFNTDFLSASMVLDGSSPSSISAQQQAQAQAQLQQLLRVQAARLRLSGLHLNPPAAIPPPAAAQPGSSSDPAAALLAALLQQSQPQPSLVPSPPPQPAVPAAVSAPPVATAAAAAAAGIVDPSLQAQAAQLIAQAARRRRPADPYQPQSSYGGSAPPGIAFSGSSGSGSANVSGYGSMEALQRARGYAPGQQPYQQAPALPPSRYNFGAPPVSSNADGGSNYPYGGGSSYDGQHAVSDVYGRHQPWVGSGGSGAPSTVPSANSSFAYHLQPQPLPQSQQVLRSPPRPDYYRHHQQQPSDQHQHQYDDVSSASAYGPYGPAPSQQQQQSSSPQHHQGPYGPYGPYGEPQPSAAVPAMRSPVGTPDRPEANLRSPQQQQQQQYQQASPPLPAHRARGWQGQEQQGDTEHTEAAATGADARAPAAPASPPIPTLRGGAGGASKAADWMSEEYPRSSSFSAASGEEDVTDVAPAARHPPNLADERPIRPVKAAVSASADDTVMSSSGELPSQTANHPIAAAPVAAKPASTGPSLTDRYAPFLPVAPRFVAWIRGWRTRRLLLSPAKGGSKRVAAHRNAIADTRKLISELTSEPPSDANSALLTSLKGQLAGELAELSRLLDGGRDKARSEHTAMLRAAAKARKVGSAAASGADDVSGGGGGEDARAALSNMTAEEKAAARRAKLKGGALGKAVMDKYSAHAHASGNSSSTAAGSGEGASDAAPTAAKTVPEKPWLKVRKASTASAASEGKAGDEDDVIVAAPKAKSKPVSSSAVDKPAATSSTASDSNDDDDASFGLHPALPSSGRWRVVVEVHSASGLAPAVIVPGLLAPGPGMAGARAPAGADPDALEHTNPEARDTYATACLAKLTSVPPLASALPPPTVKYTPDVVNGPAKVIGKKETSTTFPASLAPQWRKRCVFIVPSKLVHTASSSSDDHGSDVTASASFPGVIVRVDVTDADRFAKDTAMGQGSLPLDHLRQTADVSASAYRGWVALVPATQGDRARGKVLLRARLVAPDPELAAAEAAAAAEQQQAEAAQSKPDSGAGGVAEGSAGSGRPPRVPFSRTSRGSSAGTTAASASTASASAADDTDAPAADAAAPASSASSGSGGGAFLKRRSTAVRPAGKLDWSHVQAKTVSRSNSAGGAAMLAAVTSGSAKQQPQPLGSRGGRASFPAAGGPSSPRAGGSLGPKSKSFSAGAGAAGGGSGSGGRISDVERQAMEQEIYLAAAAAAAEAVAEAQARALAASQVSGYGDESGGYGQGEETGQFDGSASIVQLDPQAIFQSILARQQQQQQRQYNNYDQQEQQQQSYEDSHGAEPVAPSTRARAASRSSRGTSGSAAGGAGANLAEVPPSGYGQRPRSVSPRPSSAAAAGTRKGLASSSASMKQQHRDDVDFASGGGYRRVTSAGTLIVGGNGAPTQQQQQQQQSMANSKAPKPPRSSLPARSGGSKAGQKAGQQQQGPIMTAAEARAQWAKGLRGAGPARPPSAPSAGGGSHDESFEVDAAGAVMYHRQVPGLGPGKRSAAAGGGQGSGAEGTTVALLQQDPELWRQIEAAAAAAAGAGDGDGGADSQGWYDNAGDDAVAARGRPSISTSEGAGPAGFRGRRSLGPFSRTGQRQHSRAAPSSDDSGAPGTGASSFVGPDEYFAQVLQQQQQQQRHSQEEEDGGGAGYASLAASNVAIGRPPVLSRTSTASSLGVGSASGQPTPRIRPQLQKRHGLAGGARSFVVAASQVQAPQQQPSDGFIGGDDSGGGTALQLRDLQAPSSSSDDHRAGREYVISFPTGHGGADGGDEEPPPAD